MSSGGLIVQIYRKDTNFGLKRKTISLAETYRHVEYNYPITI
jgi:hypothetical protein